MTPNDLKMDPQMWGQCRYSVPRHVLFPKLHSLRPHTSGIHPSPFGAALTPQRLSRGRWGGRCRRLKPLCTIGWALAFADAACTFPQLAQPSSPHLRHPSQPIWSHTYVPALPRVPKRRQLKPLRGLHPCGNECFYRRTRPCCT